MLKRTWVLIAFVYLALAEALSFVPVPDLSLCLIEPEHSQQSANHNDAKYCPAFHTGVLAALDALDGLLERHDKSVVAGFTVILAFSTIGLWLATNKLWKAGDDQFKLLSSTAAAQSRAMQASIKVAQDSAKAAKRAADIAERGVAEVDRAWISLDAEIKGPLKFGPETIEIEIRTTFKNIGKSPAVNFRLYFDLYPSSVEAGDVINGQVRAYRNFLLSAEGYGLVLFPGGDGFRQRTISINRSDFAASIKAIDDSSTEEDRKSEGYQPFTRMNPVVLAYCMYNLPGDGHMSRARFTTLVLEVGLVDAARDGFDGSETEEFPADQIELVQSHFSGVTT